MNIIIRELRADHHNIARLLVLMRNLIGLIKKADSKNEIRNIRKCVEYMKAYPDEIHHPKEDVLFARLKERNKSSAVYVENLLDEHKILTRKSKEFYELVRGIEEGNIVSHDHLKMVSIEYIDAQFRHMRYEEASIFPMIEQELTISDWKSIILMLPSGNDPLFNKNRKKYYASLYAQLADSYKISRAK